MSPNSEKNNNETPQREEAKERPLFPWRFQTVAGQWHCWQDEDWADLSEIQFIDRHAFHLTIKDVSELLVELPWVDAATGDPAVLSIRPPTHAQPMFTFTRRAALLGADPGVSQVLYVAYGYVTYSALFQVRLFPQSGRIEHVVLPRPLAQFPF